MGFYYCHGRKLSTIVFTVLVENPRTRTRCIFEFMAIVSQYVSLKYLSTINPTYPPKRISLESIAIKCAKIPSGYFFSNNFFIVSYNRLLKLLNDIFQPLYPNKAYKINPILSLRITTQLLTSYKNMACFLFISFFFSCVNISDLSREIFFIIIVLLKPSTSNIEKTLQEKTTALIEKIPTKGQNMIPAN